MGGVLNDFKKAKKMSIGLIIILVLFGTIPLGLLGAFLGYMDEDVSPVTGFALGYRNSSCWISCYGCRNAGLGVG